MEKGQGLGKAGREMLPEKLGLPLGGVQPKDTTKPKSGRRKD